MIRRNQKESKLPYNHETSQLSAACGIDGEYRLEEMKRSIEFVRSVTSNKTSEIVEKIEAYMTDKLNNDTEKEKYIRYLAMILTLHDIGELTSLAEKASRENAE